MCFGRDSFLAVGSGYLAVGAYAQAEQALLKATFADPNDVEAKLKLAEAYKQQKKYIQAAEIFEGLLSSQPSNREYAFSAARLRLIIAKGKTGLESANHTCIGIRSLKKTRPAGNNQFSSSALDILMNIYQTVYTSGIPLEHDLLAETVYISSLEETLSNPALHRFIFQSLLASDSTIFQAMYYYEARRIPFRTDLEWNLIAYRNINRMAPAAIKLNDLKASSQPTSATTRKAVIDAGRRFKLNVSYEVANLQLKEGHGTWIESEIISAYETETEDLDSIMPDSDPDVSLWSKVRQEHVARLELLLALKSLKQLEPYGIDVMAVRSENRPSIFGSILKSLAACLSFRPLPRPV
ncbi:hypothetical protein BC829DRAFT_218758 [Chytridium lagenaria]|nr:hypothetical protein BC829DRAFT_218758 [Chytridium lagenaria]